MQNKQSIAVVENVTDSESILLCSFGLFQIIHILVILTIASLFVAGSRKRDHFADFFKIDFCYLRVE